MRANTRIRPAHAMSKKRPPPVRFIGVAFAVLLAVGGSIMVLGGTNGVRDRWQAATVMEVSAIREELAAFDAKLTAIEKEFTAIDGRLQAIVAGPSRKDLVAAQQKRATLARSYRRLVASRNQMAKELNARSLALRPELQVRIPPRVVVASAQK